MSSKSNVPSGPAPVDPSARKPAARRVSVPRAKKPTADTANEFEVKAPLARTATPPAFPDFSDDPPQAVDMTSVDTDPTAAPTPQGKRKRRRRKGKGNASQNAISAETEPTNAAPTGDPAPENTMPAPPHATPAPDSGQAPPATATVSATPAAAPAPARHAGNPPSNQPPAPRPPKIHANPELLAKHAWKIYLAEISEEGLALVTDHDARELARRCFRLAEIFLDEQSRAR